MKKIVSIVLSFTLLFTLFGCSNSKYTKFSKSFLNLFDTASSITAYDTSQAEFDKKYNKLYGEIKGYSGYDHRGCLYIWSGTDLGRSRYGNGMGYS